MRGCLWSALKRFGWLCVLGSLGVVTGNFLLALPSVRTALRIPADTPLLFGATMERIGSAVDGRGVDPAPSPSASAGKAPVPTRPRTSWALLDQGLPPTDPRTDPRDGRIWISHFQPEIEMRLSTLYRRARLPLPVLRISFVRGGEPSRCGLEIWTGSPPGRGAIEATAARVIALTFQAVPGLQELDVVAVPWRTVKKSRPPTYYSVLARRADLVDVGPLRSPQYLLEHFGPQWWDPRVRFALPVPSRGSVPSRH